MKWTVKMWVFHALFLCALLTSATLQAHEKAGSPGQLAIVVGLVSAAQLDRGYSPLNFSGVQGAVEIGYSRLHEGRERIWRLGYSTGALQNRHNRSLDALSISFLVVNLYRLGEESPFGLGWSNDNQFNTRTIDDFLNFTGRTDYFTSFGPAGKYSLEFELFGQDLHLGVLGHVQLLGFYIPSGYVASLPPGFGYEPGGFLRSVVDSLFLFYPGSAISVGMRPELQWNWRETSSLVFSYSYDFVSLRHARTSRRSQGHYLVSLKVAL